MPLLALLSPLSLFLSLSLPLSRPLALSLSLFLSSPSPVLVIFLSFSISLSLGPWAHMLHAEALSARSAAPRTQPTRLKNWDRVPGI